MNRFFKTKWSQARRQYVVTDENHRTTDRKKTVVALAVAAAGLGLGVAQAAYVTPLAGAASPEFSGTSASDATARTTADPAYVETSKLGSTKSWETDEYTKSHALTFINASQAYAEGYTGKGVLIGIVDSGAELAHTDLSGGRIFGVTASGTYYHDGDRYPFDQFAGGQADDKTGEYSKGEAFETNGDWILGINDAHGTHVTSVAAGNRNGIGSHGVAFESDVAVGNTGGTDNMNYGPYQDYNYFYAVWDAVGNTGAKVINNSWGTNIRVENDQGVVDSGWHYDVGQVGSEFDFTTGQNGVEKEYYLFREDAEKAGGKNFMDAAYEVAKKHGLIQIFTNGNRNFQNPYYRAMYPYFTPDAEQYWIAAGGVDVTADGRLVIMGNDQGVNAGTDNDHGGGGYNRAGVAKWWTITAPTNVWGASIDPATGAIDGDGNAATDSKDNHGWGTAGGTSNAAPHIAGAMGVLMGRYTYLTPTQVRDVMFTTASNTDGQEGLLEEWDSAAGVPDNDYGWGVLDLGKAIYGPGQFLGDFAVTMNDVDDTWRNDISDVAIKARKVEDEEEDAAWVKRKAVLDEKKAAGPLTKEETWEYEYKTARDEARDLRAKQGYVGRLIKDGNGTLTLTGHNTYSGGTIVNGGTVAGLSDSFGSGDVVVNAGGTVEFHTQFLLQKAGEKDWVEDKYEATVDTTDDANVVVKKGGALSVAESGVSLGNVTVEEGAIFKVGGIDETMLTDLWKDPTKAYDVTLTTKSLTGAENLTAGTDYAFFSNEIDTSTANTVKASLKKRDGGMAAAATTENGRAIGAAIEANPEGETFAAFLGATKDQAARTFDSLGSDINFTAQNLSIVNSLTLSRAVKDQSTGYGTANTAKLGNGAEVWATGIGAWSNSDAGGASTDLDADFYAGLVGVEMQVCSATKLGVFFGAGSTDFKGGVDGKIDSDDIHAGIYGETATGPVSVAYGFAWTQQDRELTRGISFMDSVGYGTSSADADLMQLFGEVAYTGLNTDAYSVEPYVGFTWVHAKADGFTETAGTTAVTSEFDNQNIEVTTLGVRGAMPFKLATVDMKVKGDVNWMHFFGDTAAEGTVRIGDAAPAALKGEELDNLFGVGLGIEAKMGESTTFGLSYTGAYGSDVTSHGVGVNVRYAF